MDTLYTFRDNITHYETESVHFWGLMNSATKFRAYRLCRAYNYRVYRVSGSGFIGFRVFKASALFNFPI